jgi:hypothetical protein
VETIKTEFKCIQLKPHALFKVETIKKKIARIGLGHSKVLLRSSGPKKENATFMNHCALLHRSMSAH